MYVYYMRVITHNENTLQKTSENTVRQSDRTVWNRAISGVVDEVKTNTFNLSLYSKRSQSILK